MKCAQCGYDIFEGTSCPACGYENSTTNASASADAGAAAAPSFDEYAPEIPIKPVFPMKWYKFLLVLLWIGAVLNFFNAISIFTGAEYEGSADVVYEMYPTLKLIDMLSGVNTLLMCAFQIFTWYSLKSYKRKAPMYLTILYAWGIAFTVVYAAAYFVAIGESPLELFSALNYPAIFTPVALIIYNRTYFNKRAELFVN